MIGILNIDKPPKMTSHAVISKVRRILSERTVGHMGTLDPQGTGVLIVGVGKATRLFDYYLNKDKVYVAEFCFGYETDTLDKDGTVLKTTDVIPTKEQIINALNAQTGKINQIPPLYSAKSVAGVRAYELARKGIAVELKPCAVEIYSINLLEQTEPNTYKFRIHCSSGTYIRSICRDLSYSLNSLATMTSIDRVRSGAFLKENAVKLEDLEVLKESALITVDEALKDCKRVDLPNELYEPLINGKKIPFDKTDEPFTVYCKNELFGLGIVKDGILKIDVYLRA